MEEGGEEGVTIEAGEEVSSNVTICQLQHVLQYVN